MRLLCFDISSGGISAVLFNSRLEPTRFTEIQWERAGAATLPAGTVAAQFKQIIQRLNLGRAESIDAVCIGSFMHNCVLLDAADEPLTPVFTWLDQRGESGIEYVRSRIGDAFHERTGCRFHPLFPIFKLAAIHLSDAQLLQRTKRVVSIKAFLVHRLAGTWVEDHGMASASGFFKIAEGDWDLELLSILGLNRSNVPPVRGRTEIVGRVTTEGAREFALAEGVPVINGSGDGFLANVGSGC